jgi:cyclic pyranopterin phosphate synthase
MPAEGVALKPRDEIVRFEAIAKIVAVGAKLGIRKVKLTGGEPLVRRNIERLVAMVARIPGIIDFGMSTNGSLLTKEKAGELKAAGLMRVNISLDTLDGARFKELTRGGNIQKVLAGIDAALAAGLTPVKVNMVVFSETSAEAIESMRSFCAGKGVVLQTIRCFDLTARKTDGRGPIPTDRPHLCAQCDRLRLTADGFLKSCLHSDGEIKVDFTDIEKSIREAVRNKPRAGELCRQRVMSQIGG